MFQKAILVALFALTFGTAALAESYRWQDPSCHYNRRTGACMNTPWGNQQYGHPPYRRYPGTRRQDYVGSRVFQRRPQVHYGEPRHYGGGVIQAPPRLLGYQVCTEGVGCHFVPAE